MSEPVLSLRGVERIYVTEAGSLPVLKGVDLDVFPGEIVGLIGPSGSGKSSLIAVAAEGSVSVTASSFSGVVSVATSYIGNADHVERASRRPT